jgi:hypothetical protein
MAQIKLAFHQNKPCFQHDGGSGYIETGNRLILNAMDESFKPGAETVDYLTRHRRRVDIHFSAALYPQNWVAGFHEYGCMPTEINRLNGLMEAINEHIAARQELPLNQFFLYFTVAYDFQLVWAADDAATLALPEAARSTQALESITLKMVHEDGKPVFALLVGKVGVFKKGQILRLFPKPALKEEKCDSIDIGIVPTRSLEGEFGWTSAVKVNNYGNIAGPVLNQEYWGPLLTAIDEAIAETKDIDFSEMVEFLRDAFLMMVADHGDDLINPSAGVAASSHPEPQPANSPRMTSRVIRARLASPEAAASQDTPTPPDEPPPSPAQPVRPHFAPKPARMDRRALALLIFLVALFLLLLFAPNLFFLLENLR